MFEAEVYQKAIESAQAWALRENEQNRARRLDLVDRWHKDADWNRANGRPQPPQPPAPAPILSIQAPAGGSDQSQIVVKVGPGFVADPAELVLAPIKSYAVTDFPPNVTAPGIDWGDTMGALPQDTRPTGFVLELNGKRWEKIETTWVFGRKSFYKLVK
jgi:hypothetical protein